MSQFYGRSRVRANIGYAAIIITCFIGRANEFLAAMHVYKPARKYVNDMHCSFRSCARTFALAPRTVR